MNPTKKSTCTTTPLAKKLGIKRGCRICLLQAPKGYSRLLEPLPEEVQFDGEATAETQIVQLFVQDRALLAQQLVHLRQTLHPDAAVWVSWPKKASNIPSTVTEDVIRAVAFPMGFVDIKVCAVDAIWSGLKLVVRRALR